MFFCGDFFCASSMSVACTPTSIENITRIELSNGWYDDLRFTKNVTDELSVQIPQEWDWDTMFHAKFDGDTHAGNVKWDLDTVSHVIVKRKKANEFKWMTLKVQKTYTNDDFNIEDVDLTATPTVEYQYAVVPIIDGVEGFYSIDSVEVNADGIVIIDRDELWQTNVTDNYLDNTSVVPNSVVNTMYDTYPTIVSNSNANYEQITVNAQFFPSDDEEGCEMITDDIGRIINYNRRAKMFLRNKNVKLLKSESGENWLVFVTTPPSDTATDHYANRKISFTCTEVGSVESEEDLWESGVLDASVTENWWNK